VVERVREAFGDSKAELLETNLSAEDEAKLREVFAED
jgi:uncharacterized membrane protein